MTVRAVGEQNPNTNWLRWLGRPSQTISSLPDASGRRGAGKVDRPPSRAIADSFIFARGCAMACHEKPGFKCTTLHYRGGTRESPCQCRKGCGHWRRHAAVPSKSTILLKDTLKRPEYLYIYSILL
jgi:hypothetical protein